MNLLRATTWRWAAALSLGAIFAATAPACQQKADPYEVGFGVPDTGSSREAPPKMSQRCPLNEVVREPQHGTAEFVLKELLAAAASPEENEETFQRFFRQFEGQQESWVRDQYWKRARTHVKKYLADGEDVVYTICRRVDQTDTHVKVFIQSNDEQKSNPPITLKKNADGEWKVSAYTP